MARGGGGFLSVYFIFSSIVARPCYTLWNDNLMPCWTLSQSVSQSVEPSAVEHLSACDFRPDWNCLFYRSAEAGSLLNKDIAYTHSACS